MISAIRYSAAATNARGILSDLLQEEDWRRLLNASDLGNFTDVLGTTYYSRGLSPNTKSPERIEKQLERFLSQRVFGPSVFLSGTAKDLYLMHWRAYEMEDLFIVLRGIHNNVKPNRIRASITPLGGVSPLDWRSLSGARSVSDLIEQLDAHSHGRFYTQFLKAAVNEYKRQKRIAVLELAVNLGYYRELRKLLGALSGKDAEAAQSIDGLIIDSRLVLWAARYRVFFKLSPKDIMGLILHYGVRIQAEHLKRIATGANILSVVKEIWNEDIFTDAGLEEMDERNVIVRLELLFRRYRHKLAEKLISGYPFGLGILLAYIVVLEDETHDIMTIMEAVLEAWEKQEIENQLIAKRL